MRLLVIVLMSFSSFTFGQTFQSEKALKKVFLKKDTSHLLQQNFIRDEGVWVNENRREIVQLNKKSISYTFKEYILGTNDMRSAENAVGISYAWKRIFFKSKKTLESSGEGYSLLQIQRRNYTLSLKEYYKTELFIVLIEFH